MNKKKFLTKIIFTPKWGGLKHPPHSLCINYPTLPSFWERRKGKP
jgi:hypothetical protein